MDGQGTKCHRKIAESYNRLSREHERYRQTDGRATANSERSLKSHIQTSQNFVYVLIVAVVRSSSDNDALWGCAF